MKRGGNEGVWSQGGESEGSRDTTGRVSMCWCACEAGRQRERSRPAGRTAMLAEAEVQKIVMVSVSSGVRRGVRVIG